MPDFPTPPPSPQRVSLVDPVTGGFFDIDAADAGYYLDRGWKPQTAADVGAAANVAARETDYGGVAGGIKASLAGIGRGLTLGGTDVAARLLGGEQTAATLRELREEHPYLSAGTEIAGAVAPALVTGGGSLPASAASRAGARVAEGLGGRLLARAAGGATEGALFGAGQGVSELALSSDPLTIEHAASVIGSNTLYGGAIGLGAGAGSALVERGLLRGKEAIDRALLARSEGRAMKAVGELEAAAAAEPGAITAETDLTLLDRRGLESAREQEITRIESSLVPEREKFVSELGAFYDDMAKAKLSKTVTGVADDAVRRDGAALKTADFRLRRLSDNEAGLASNPARALDALQTQQQALTGIRDWLDEEMGQFWHKVREATPGVRRDLLEGKLEGYVHSALKQEGRELAVQQELARRFGGHVDADGLLEAPENLRVERFEAIENAIARNKALQAQLARVTAEPTSERLAQIEAAEQALGARTAAPKIEQAPSLGKQALHTAAAVFGGPVGAAVATGSRVLNGFKTAIGASAERAGQAVSRFLGGAVKASEAAAPYAPVIATKVLAGLRYGESKDRKDAEDPKTLAGLFKARTDEIKQQTQYDATGVPKMRPEARQAMADRLRAVGVVDPILADRLESKGARRIEYLSSLIPRRPDLAGIPSGPDHWQPSDMAMRSWARSAAAVEDPLAVLERAAHGAVTPEDAAAMRAVHPELLHEWQMQVTSQLASLRKSLPPGAKLALSILTGVPVDPALDPRILSVLQAQFTEEPGSAGGTQAPKAQPQFGSIKKSLDAPTPAQTRAQGAHG